jgi:hypothetical protein
MAVTAGQFGVATQQIKIRVARVVETGIVPVAGVVTIFAPVAAASVMRVILCMAIETFRWRIRESAVLVAVKTSDFKVLAKQWVVRRRVVELGLQPFRWRVAVDTVSTHSILVGLVFLVAVNARRGCFPVLQIGPVAIFAGGIFVRTQ